jgi:hypothetical protein
VDNIENNVLYTTNPELLVVPVNSDFGFHSQKEQLEILKGWRDKAEAQGLRGELFLVFDSPNGAIPFPVNPRSEAFCKEHRNVGITRAMCNRKVTW